MQVQAVCGSLGESPPDVMSELEPDSLADHSSAIAAEAEPYPILGKILLSQIDALIGLRRRVLRTDEPEAIHKMRVATRRLQASLDLLQTRDGGLGGGKINAAVGKVKKRLRRSRRALAKVRNADVFLGLISDYSPKSVEAKARRFELLTSILRGKRERNSEKSRLYLDAHGFSETAALLELTPALSPNPDSSGSLISDAADLSQPALQSVLPAATTLLNPIGIRIAAAGRLERRLAEFHALALAAHPASAPIELHKVRIAAKKLRYLLELISMMGIADPAREIGWLRHLQDKIGDWHDLHAIEEEIIKIVTRRNFARKHVPDCADMLALAARFRRKKAPLARSIFPIKPPRSLDVAVKRLAKRLHREVGS